MCTVILIFTARAKIQFGILLLHSCASSVSLQTAHKRCCFGHEAAAVAVAAVAVHFLLKKVVFLLLS